jgi:signal peptidase II
VTPGATGVTQRPRPHWVVFVVLAAVVVGLDQLAKAWLVANVAPGQVVSVAGDTLRLTFNQNSGALFGLFHDNAVAFGIVSLGVVAIIVLYHARSTRSLYLTVALGLLLGGALGNMADRLLRGFVVDFIDLGLGTVRWFTFNVADAAISAAIVLLVAAAFIPALGAQLERQTDG